MNSIYVATNLAEDLIVKRCGIFVCRLCRSCSLFRYELITKPQDLQGGNRPIMVYLVRVVLAIKCFPACLLIFYVHLDGIDSTVQYSAILAQVG